MLVWGWTESGRNRTPKRVLYINLETTRLRWRPRNRWQDEVRENGRIVGSKEWQEKVYNREERKKLLRMTMNCHVLHMLMELMNGMCVKIQNYIGHGTWHKIQHTH
jgi:hypothetical protein